VQILFVTSELAPLIKTGGLADVSAALPAALIQAGHDVRVLLPGYSEVLTRARETRLAAAVDPAGSLPACRVLSAQQAGGPALLIVDCARLYAREGGPYQDAAGRDWPDNALRFGLLSRVGALLASASSPLAWRPDIIHCNDWQAGLAPVYLNFSPGQRAASVVTIHNLAFQGIFPPAAVRELALPDASFAAEGAEYYGQLSFLKGALYYADRITTVSPTYAREIQTAALGFGLQGLLAARSPALSGILNGIDVDTWNPATDPALAQRYDSSRLALKSANKLALQQRTGLEIAARLPLFGVVSRLTAQKGLDLLLEIADELVRLPAQLAVLGSGDPQLEHGFAETAKRHAGMIGYSGGYDEPLAHLIEGGADAFVMPSRFEPCGLNQMYSQRYGTPPIVRLTGGLADSVVDYSEATLAAGSAGGFTFSELSGAGLLAALRRALAVFHEPDKWRALQTNAMARDFSWRRSAERYIALYSAALHERSGR
jgi:starch synthase